MFMGRAMLFASLVLVLLVQDNALAQQSIGCFKSLSLDPDLPITVARRVGTPVECIAECKARHYKFSGMMHGYQCFCGSQYGKAGPSDECKIPCVNDTTSICGSDEAINIYSTGQKGPSPPRRVKIISYSQDSLGVSWLPPDIPNGKIISYTLKAIPLRTNAQFPLLPVQSDVQGESANITTLYGLHAGTEYNITIVAFNSQGFSEEAYTVDWTHIGPPEKPPKPKIIDKTEKTITIEVPEGRSENGPLTFYHIVVVLPGVVPPKSNDIAYENYDAASRSGLGYYVTGKFDTSDYGRNKIFEVGNGKLIGGYYNAPLDMKNGQPQIGVAVESRIRGEVQYSYSDLTSSNHRSLAHGAKDSGINAANVILWVLIVLLSLILLASVLAFLMLRKRLQNVQMHRLPEQQELSLQGPSFEVDNMAYIPEDIPERVNHYQELKSKVWSIPLNALNCDVNPTKRFRFGTIHSGTVQKDNFNIPVSILKISDTQLRNSEKRKMLRELDTCIKSGSYKYLSSLVGNCETPDTLYVAFEQPTQCLKMRLLAARSGDHFPHEYILKIGACIADALRYLESLKVVHTCVCARSVGLNNDWSPKIMGHGISKHVLEDAKYARWTALECFENIKKQNGPSMVWAFGVLLWEMFSLGGTPYHNLEMDSDVEEALNRNERLQQLPDVTDPVYEVMSSCWLADPEERPTFDELIRLDTLTILPITSITEPYRPELELN
ncbi:hypothetical protein TKK_0007261 [Trichogramma kaykai]|uniref:Tyrosine-protein kinase Wsck n=1 Tax=Trichogramma kaykai TaxID=54128 RepID=A0ABD2X8T9_9HYME